MNAYELFCQDTMGDELIRARTDRRTYYNALRKLLREELAGAGSCELLTHFGRRLQEGAPGGLYLLDAAALWECYEATVGGLRFPRDIGQGVPFPLSNGRRLSWSEVQRLSDQRMLPAAVLDAELRARLQGLLLYAQAPASGRAGLIVPEVNPRAKLQVADAGAIGPIAAPGGAAKAEDGAALADMAALVERQKQQIAALQAERDALKAETARLQQRPRADAGELMQVADLILHNRMAEAASQAQRIGGELEGELQRLQEQQAALTEQQEQLAAARTQLQADSAQAEALRAQQRAAGQALEAVRRECAQAQRDAAACLQEKQEAEKALTEAREKLSRANAELRELQRRIAHTHAAADLTRRQADRLS